jgi:hypothetical protein
LLKIIGNYYFKYQKSIMAYGTSDFKLYVPLMYILID